jgi:hypothetical protein
LRRHNDPAGVLAIIIMSERDRRAQLLSERALAKVALESSACWTAWKTATAAVDSSTFVELEGALSSLPVIAPEQLLDLADGGLDAWDEQDPVLRAYEAARHVDELRAQLVSSLEWRVFQEAQQRLHLFAKEEVTKKRAEWIQKQQRTSVRTSSTVLSPASDPTTTSMIRAVVDDGPAPAALMLIVNNSRSPLSISRADSSASTGAALSVVASTPPRPEYAPSHETEVPSKPSSPTTNQQGSTSSSSSSSSPSSSSSEPASIMTPQAVIPSAQSPPTPPLRAAATANLKRPEWCRVIVEDGGVVLDERCLGLVNQEVQQMCGTVRPQLQRVWSSRGPCSLLAALVTARDFQPGSWTHPTVAQMEDVRRRVHDLVHEQTDEAFAAIVPSYKRETYMTQFLAASASPQELDMSFLRLYRAAQSPAPRICVLSVTSSGDMDTSSSLKVIGNRHGGAAAIVLYRHASISPGGHFEAVSWKPSRGGVPLTTHFTSSHELIVALDKWHGSPSRSPSPAKKRARHSQTNQTDQHADSDPADDDLSEKGVAMSS